MLDEELESGLVEAGNVTAVKLDELERVLEELGYSDEVGVAELLPGILVI